MILRPAKTLDILRGPSGSGKSTWARKQKNAYVCSTDDYFLKVINEEIVYDFDHTKLSKAHRWNENRVKAAMQIGIKNIIIDNTCIEPWEMHFYVKEGLKRGYEIKIHNFGQNLSLEELTERSKNSGHNVPSFIVEKMMTNFKENENLSIEDIMNSKKPYRLTFVGRNLNKITKI